MTGIKRVTVPISLLGGAALLFAGGIAATIYTVGRLRVLEGELADTRLQVERLRKTPIAPVAPASSASPSTVAASLDEIDELRGDVARVREELQRIQETHTPALAAVPPPADSTLVAGVQPASGMNAAPGADEAMGRILAVLEDQDQALLKEAVKEVLQQKEREEQDARLKRQNEELVKQLTKVLDLNPTQADQVRAIVQERTRAVEQLRATVTDANRKQVRQQIDAVQQDGEKQLVQSLTADQAAKYQDWQKKRQGGDRRRGGGGRK